MEDHVLGALNGLKGLFDKVLPGLHQHLDGHVVGDVPAVDKGAEELILRLRGGGEAHLDFLDPDVYQSVEQLQLFCHAHGIDEGLVAVAQVHRAPHRRGGDALIRPGAVGQGNGLKGDVLLAGLVHGVEYLLGSAAGQQKSPDRGSVRGVSITRYHPVSALSHPRALNGFQQSLEG